MRVKTLKVEVSMAFFFAEICLPVMAVILICELVWYGLNGNEGGAWFT